MKPRVPLIPEQLTLEQRAARERLVYVPIALDVAQKLEREPDGPVEVRLAPDPSGHRLLRQLIVRRLA